MKHLFTLVFFNTIAIFSYSQSFDLGSQLTGASPIRTTNGCVSACNAYCSPTGTGNHAATPCTGILSVPPMQYISITILTNACDAGAGLDSGDGVSVNGVSTGTYSSNQQVNYSGCFFNPNSIAVDIPIVLTVNRRDETVNVVGTVSSTNPGGCTSLGVLPVTFSKFLATAIKNTSILSFATASETNNDFFAIERSADGTSFEAIGEIKGAGNSNTTLSYEFTDERPIAGANYYRIKQTDYDGKFSYTDIKSVRHNTFGNLNITPRTTEGRLQITTDAEDYTLDVYNVAGQQVKSYPSLSLDQSISIDELTAGLYFIKVNVGGQVETTKIVKL